MSLITRTDVTAVKFHKDLILAGIGSTIQIFDKVTSKFLQRLIALNGQKVYGFVPSVCGENILVFGGKQFTMVSMRYSEEFLSRQFEPMVCDDWFHSAVWIDKDTVALLTAHNVVEKWNIRTQEKLSHHPSRDNSILYSGLLLSIQDDLLVMAGTVFSEIIIHKCEDLQPLHNLKGHKGVIFSVSCKPEYHIIVTTSDDRSVRIWGPNIIPSVSPNSIVYWQSINIVCKHEVYGHLARVMRSFITNDIIISVGEDSAVCYWDHEGKLLRKSLTHQNGCIWAVDSDGDILITGGGDCGVIIHPLSIAKEYSQSNVIDIGDTTPRKVEFTARKNLVITEDNDLIYYNFSNKTKTIFELKYSSTYRLLSLSSCKQLIAIADMTGKLDIFSESCKSDVVVTKLIDTELNIGKVLSMQWAGNRYLVFCTDNGSITVFSSNGVSVQQYAYFKLPPCKEALLTAAAIDYSSNLFVVGDRCGNIHIFAIGQKDPIKSFNKVHGRYGPRSLLFKGKDIISTGRNHSIKYFGCNNGKFMFMYSKDLPFAWVEKFLDKDENVVCGFQERLFVVYNIKDNTKVLETPCGGGHRSFDAIRYIEKRNNNFEEIIKLVYIKDSDINIVTFQLSKIVSRNIVKGSHTKEINCLKSHKLNDVTIHISGGEDTTLRISSVDAAMNFQDEICFKHLSSVRTLKTHFLNNNIFFIISAGGRAQICVKKIKVTLDGFRVKVISEELVDYLIKGTDKERKGHRLWKNCYVDIDPEMRIMDIDSFEDKNNLIVFAGCSDAYLRIFLFDQDKKKLTLINESKYHTTCILKTRYVKILDRNVLVTCTTRGDVAFWDASDVMESNLVPYFTLKPHKSGINSFDFITIDYNKFLIGTGGDDNAIHLLLLEITDQCSLNSIKVVHSWSCSNYHSSQITGLCLIDDYLLTTSIDQRITLLQWKINEENIECNFVAQIFTDVADVQGMDIVECNSDTITVCVFGKGIEVIAVPKIK